MESYGSAPSWWSWQETKSSEWKALGRKLPGPFKGYKPVRSHPVMKKGSRGDQVVWLQQYLNGAGNKVPVTGIFAKKTKAKVAAFQRSRNLEADGVVGRQTWKRLLKVRPVRVRWSAARSRALNGRISGAVPGEPASAGIPAVRNEIAGAKQP
jgi:peptidoglycan hydrolase-like protein with peptidoglycan-binding domain